MSPGARRCEEPVQQEFKRVNTDGRAHTHRVGNLQSYSQVCVLGGRGSGFTCANCRYPFSFSITTKRSQSD